MSDAPPFRDPEMHRPIINTDGGPWAAHDMACAVCQDRSAVLDLNVGHFQPCWECQRDGWHLARRHWWQRKRR